MSSNINPYNIDGTFPVAGQDNSSQGFRDNFTNTKNNFIFAATEISDLQSKAIVTSALTGQSLNNDMAGTQIRRPQLASWTQSLLDLGVASGGISLDFNQANFQKITTGGPITLSFTNWPASIGSGALGYAVMRVWIVVTNLSYTITLPSSVNIGLFDLAGYNSNTRELTPDITGNYIFDFTSVDGGVTYQIFDLRRNRSSFRDPSFYYLSTQSPVFYLGYNSQSFKLAANNEPSLQNTLSVFGSINTISLGNLTLANTSYYQTDTVGVPGYSVTGFRGNASNASDPIFSLTNSPTNAARSGDLIGYYNAYTYTGSAAGNVIQQSGSLTFFATGSNVTYGLGGNVTVWTRPDGGTAQAVRQVAGFENDLSTKLYGNVEIVGNLKTDSGIIDNGTYVTIIPTTGGSFAANAAISSLVIDSALSASIAWANVTLPANPVNGQRIRITSIAPIVNANINAPAGAAIKNIPTNKYSSGNVSSMLTYISSYSTWYLS
jgi:hypothetical protein